MAKYSYVPTEDIAIKCEFTVHDLKVLDRVLTCLLYTSPSPRDRTRSRMPSSA